MKKQTWKSIFASLFATLALCLVFGSCDVTAGGGGGGGFVPDGELPAYVEPDFNGPLVTDKDLVKAIGGFVVTVNPNTVLNTMSGFGASDCWAGNFIGRWGTDWYPNKNSTKTMVMTSPGVNAEALKQQAADWLFSQEIDPVNGSPKGIGLSEWRVNLGAGSWEQAWEKDRNSKIGTIDRNWNNAMGKWERNAESFLADIDFPYLTIGGQPSASESDNSRINYDWTRQWGQQYWMKEAKKRGTEYLVAFSNSPPVVWTLSGTGNNAALNSATPNSSGRYTQLNHTGNLKDDNYTTFAAYMADIAEHFAQETVVGFGADKTPIPLRFNYISPVNEPQWEWNEDKQEGTRWNNANIAKVVRALDAEIVKASRPNISAANTKILITETAQWNFLYGSNTYAGNQLAEFFVTSHANYVGGLASMQPWTVGGHTYFTHPNDSETVSVRTQLKNAAATRGNVAANGSKPIRIMSTEWCGLGGGSGMHAGGGTSIDTASHFDIALFMAKLAHQDITVANAETFSFWTAFDIEGGAKSRYTLIAYTPGTAAYTPNSYQNYGYNRPGAMKTQSTLWALGHFSLFVRPGFLRIPVSNGIGGGTSTLDTDAHMGLMATAYKSPAGYKDFTSGKVLDRIVVVYVNIGTTPRIVTSDFTGKGTPESIMAFLTIQNYVNDASDLKRQGMRRVSHFVGIGDDDDDMVYIPGIIQIPGRSIMTVVYDF